MVLQGKSDCSSFKLFGFSCQRLCENCGQQIVCYWQALHYRTIFMNFGHCWTSYYLMSSAQLMWVLLIVFCRACNYYRPKKQQFIIFCLWRVWLCEYCTWTGTNNHLYASSEKYFSLPSSQSYTVPHTSNYSN